MYLNDKDACNDHSSIQKLYINLINKYTAGRIRQCNSFDVDENFDCRISLEKPFVKIQIFLAKAF